MLEFDDLEKYQFVLNAAADIMPLNQTWEMPAEPVTEMLEYRGSSWFCIGYCSSHGMLTLPGDRASWPETKSLILTVDHKTVKLADSGLAGEESLTEMKTAETGTYRWIAPGLYSTVTWKHGGLKEDEAHHLPQSDTDQDEHEIDDNFRGHGNFGGGRIYVRNEFGNLGEFYGWKRGL